MMLKASGIMLGCVCEGGGRYFKSLEGKRCPEKEADVPRRADRQLWKENPFPMVKSPL